MTIYKNIKFDKNYNKKRDDYSRYSISMIFELSNSRVIHARSAMSLTLVKTFLSLLLHLF